MITIYGIKNCNTMQKAMQWLDAHNIAYTFHDYKKSGADADKLTSWIKRTSVEAIVNSKGLTFKKLGDAEKKKALGSSTGAVELLIKNTSMIKRPIVEAGKKLLLGFDEEEWSNTLL